jgi:hypothetical protein
LTPAWTHVGLGTAATGDAMVASLMYLTIPPWLEVEATRRAIAAQLTRSTKKIVADAELAEIAQRFAVRMTRGRSQASVWEELKPQVDAAGGRFTRINHSVLHLRELDAAQIARRLDLTDVDDVGVGVAQADHATFGRRTIWVVVFSARRLRPRL